MDAEEIAKAKTRRATMKGCITKIKNFVDQNVATITREELETRLGLLERYFQQILALQDAIETEDPSQLTQRDELEAQYCGTKSTILKLLHGINAQINESMHKFSPAQQEKMEPSFFASKVHPRLPKLALPTFSGNYTEYMSFINKFKTLVGDCKGIDSVQKFQHLLTCLEGQARELLEGLEITDANYTHALELLKSHYENKSLIFQAHVRQLFDVPVAINGIPSELRSLMDKLNDNLRALNSLGSKEEILNVIILHIVKEKLDEQSLNKWEESLDFSEIPTWEACYEFLNKRCQQLETRNHSIEGKISHNTRSKFGNKGNKQSTSLAAFNLNCLHCQRTNHTIEQCFNDRFRQAKKLGVCLNCLSKGHIADKCAMPHCKICEAPHNHLLHRFTTSEAQSSNQGPETSLTTSNSTIEPPQGSSTSLHSQLTINNADQVILATAIVWIKNKFGELIPARAVLDSASTLNFITEDLAKKLLLKRRRLNQEISGIAEVSSKSKFSVNARIRSQSKGFETDLEAWVLPCITGLQPERKINIANWNIPTNIRLADAAFNIPQKIDMLLGAGVVYDALTEGTVKIAGDLPTLMNTEFGWIVGGRYNRSANIHQSTSLLAQTRLEYTYENLSEQVERFWKVEDLVTNGSNWTQEEQDAEQHFLETISFSPERRLIVKLPLKSSSSQLGSSFDIAKSRFLSLEKKLGKNSELKDQCIQFMREYETLGHMKPMDIECELAKYYIPHHAVLRPESSSTKLRVVFDASCRTSSNISLNDILMCGPVVQNDIFSILIRFRCHKFAIIADIPKMYRQIWVTEDDWLYQAILWRENPNDELRTFQLKTVTYGTRSAPFQATRCLNYLADNHREVYPDGHRVVRSDFYMDDLISGGETLAELNKIKDEVEAILDHGGMRLKKWFSNEKNFLDKISESDRETPRQINDAEIIKTLGIMWDPIADHLSFGLELNELPSEITKRVVLSDLAKLFDPLGLLNPIIIRAKMFMQELWAMKLDWDQTLPPTDSKKWIEFRQQLCEVSRIRVPRWLYALNGSTAVELHGFADASSRAYGCCFYLRVLDSFGNIFVKLVTAKSRVAPLKTVTLPRLELLAASLLASLYKSVRILFASITTVYLWSDSEIVLHWIHRHPSTWTTFVANRVAQIQELTAKDVLWRHVNSKANPADLISRGATVDKLLDSMWFEGPDFLKKEEELWPGTKLFDPTKDNLPEIRTPKPVLIGTKSEDDFISNHKYVNSHRKFIRIFGYVIRFINILSLRRQGKDYHEREELTPLELEAAFNRMVYVLQRQYFSAEIKTLQHNGQISPKSTVKSLCPFLDDSTPKLLRVGGRLQNANLPYNVKHPLLLPKNHPFVYAYVKFIHLRSLHAGCQSLVATLRQKVWILNGKSVANWVVRKCIHCFHYRPRIVNQIMGALPTLRTQAIRAFCHAGVDFCGPFWTSYKLRGKRWQKSYLAVFVCFATKVVHLEVVSDLTSDAFIAALKRFISRRGVCSTLSCDNATNFVGAKTKMEEFRQKFYAEQHRKQLLDYCTDSGIKFHFIPPRAPHFGGLWEAAVKSAKYHLVRTLESSALTFEELSTVATQVEAILNSRPIAAMSSDPNDEMALTPGHFLVCGPINALPDPDLTERRLSSLTRWQVLSAVQQHFWRRWSHEYVPQLQQRHKWLTASSNIKEDMLVLVVDDQLPPQGWLLGRIVKVIPGIDGRVRVIDIRKKGGIIRRPITKVAPLPMDEQLC